MNAPPTQKKKCQANQENKIFVCFKAALTDLTLSFGFCSYSLLTRYMLCCNHPWRQPVGDEDPNSSLWVDFWASLQSLVGTRGCGVDSGRLLSSGSQSCDVPTCHSLHLLGNWVVVQLLSFLKKGASSPQGSLLDGFLWDALSHD